MRERVFGSLIFKKGRMPVSAVEDGAEAGMGAKPSVGVEVAGGVEGGVGSEAG
jgi:hypothetical protein